jgi:hypothetical protein
VEAHIIGCVKKGAAFSSGTIVFKEGTFRWVHRSKEYGLYLLRNLSNFLEIMLLL